MSLAFQLKEHVKDVQKVDQDKKNSAIGAESNLLIEIKGQQAARFLVTA